MFFCCRNWCCWRNWLWWLVGLVLLFWLWCGWSFCCGVVKYRCCNLLWSWLCFVGWVVWIWYGYGYLWWLVCGFVVMLDCCCVCLLFWWWDWYCFFFGWMFVWMLLCWWLGFFVLVMSCCWILGRIGSYVWVDWSVFDWFCGV